VEVAGRFLANSGASLRAAALEGFGIILQAEDMLRDDLAAGRLVRVLPDHAGPSLPKYLVFPPSHRPTPKLRSFIDFVVGEFG
jgi:DNA-binding transcriptional LysR family regulator